MAKRKRDDGDDDDDSNNSDENSESPSNHKEEEPLEDEDDDEDDPNKKKIRKFLTDLQNEQKDEIEIAIVLLLNTIKNNDDLQQTALELRALSIVANAMRLHRRSRSIQYHGCRIIQELLMADILGEDATFKKEKLIMPLMVEVFLPESILKAMRLFEDDEDLILAAMQALDFLATTVAPDLTEMKTLILWNKFIEKMDGIGWILQVMRLNVTNFKLVRSGCEFLKCLPLEGVQKTSGVAKTLKAVINEHQERPGAEKYMDKLSEFRARLKSVEGAH